MLARRVTGVTELKGETVNGSVKISLIGPDKAPMVTMEGCEVPTVGEQPLAEGDPWTAPVPPFRLNAWPDAFKLKAQVAPVWLTVKPVLPISIVPVRVAPFGFAGTL